MGLLDKFVRKPQDEEAEVEIASTDFTKVEFEAKEIAQEEILDEEIAVRHQTFEEIETKEVDIRSQDIREIDALREDTTRMLSDLRESMRLSQDTIGDIRKLTAFLEVAEANMLSLERLRPENDRLKNKLETIQSEISKADLRVHEMESKAHAFKSRFDQSFDELEATRSRLVEVQEKYRREKTKREETVNNVDRLMAEIRDQRGTIQRLESERDGLKENIGESTESRLTLNRKITELMKRAEYLTAQIDDERRTKDLAVSKLRTLKRDYTELKANHVQALSQVELSRNEVASSHNILAEFQKRSEDKIFALTAAMDSHKTQKKISDDMSRYEETEKAKLKSEANRAKREARKLEKALKENLQDLAENREALAKANARNEDLNDKFLSMMVEMDSLRRAHSHQARKLGEYSSIEGIAAGQDFQPEIRSNKPRTRPADQLSGETIRGAGTIANLKLVTDPIKNT